MLGNEVNVRKIYSDTYKLYQEWTQFHDMARFNAHAAKISAEHKNHFCNNMMITLGLQVAAEKEEMDKAASGGSARAKVAAW